MTYSFRFITLVALVITCLIAANITGVKLISVFDQVLNAGIVIFPVSYILGDVLTEVYGYRETRRVIWLGFLCNLIVVAAIWIGLVLPAASHCVAKPGTNSSTSPGRSCPSDAGNGRMSSD